MLKLPAATSDFTRASDLRIPTRDGNVLLADHLAPVGPAKGTIVVRGPYGFDTLGTTVHGGIFASYGYHVLLVRSRGTFGSGGSFDPFVREIEDSADTVAWLREQTFFTGRFATFGGSYLGFTQWALLMDPPPELATAVMQVAPHDFSRAIYANGVFNLNTILSWSDEVTHQEQFSPPRAYLRAATAVRRQVPAQVTLPLAAAADELCQGQAPWFREWATRRDLSDPFWERMQLNDALDRVEVPLLLQTGWQDLFLDQTIEQYEHLRARGIDVALTVGPWTHQGSALKGYETLIPEALDWLAEHLEESRPHRQTRPVRILPTGTNQWQDLPAWPPPTQEMTLHLRLGGSLGEQPTLTGTAPATFTYDPNDPTPSIGGRLLQPALSGYKDDSALAERSDVLTFTGPPLSGPLDIAGSPVLELAHSSDNPHADLFVRISEVDPEGRSHNVTDGFIRLDPAGDGGHVRITFDPTAHQFAAGNRIRLLVAGGCFPRFERNLGTGQAPGDSVDTAPSHRTVNPADSRLLLPVRQ